MMEYIKPQDYIENKREKRILDKLKQEIEETKKYHYIDYSGDEECNILIKPLEELINLYEQEKIKNQELLIKYDNILKERNKIINLMAEKLTSPIHNKKDVIEYFEKEVKTNGK